MPQFGEAWHQQSDEEAGHQTAQMRRHADSRRDNVENDLEKHDDDNVAETLLGEGQVTIAEKITGPGSRDAHDAPRSAYQFDGREKTSFHEHDDRQACPDA